jgi:serine/threonine-protein kinase
VGLALAAVKEALAGQYAVERALGRGGMASVYLANDSRAARAVAVKVLHPEFAATLGPERFHREVKLLSRFNHLNILPMLTSGQTEEFLYLVTPYAAGGSLRTVLGRERQLSLERTLAIARDVAAGLDYIHAQGVVHRDIKPENILFEGERALLCDFGVARAIVAAADDRISSSGLVVGTPGYMSPEQAEGKSEIDHRTDIYSFACVIYEMLVGEPPFTGRTRAAVLQKVIKERPSGARVVRPEVPEAVEAALLRALAKDPNDRPESSDRLLGFLGLGP